MIKIIEDYQFKEDEIIKREAVLEGGHRYILKRTWDEDLPTLMWILLNPSIADDQEDDPTARKCMGFAKGLGYGSVEILNLFAYIATDPEDLKATIESKGMNYAVGKNNDDYIRKVADRSGLIIAGWGNNAKNYDRHREVLGILGDKNVKALKINKSGHPKHPLYEGYLNIQSEDDLFELEF